MQKVVLSLDIHDDKKCKQRAMKIASGFPGVNQISVDTKEQKLTLIGSMDAVEVVKKLRKVYHTTIVTIEPAKEPEKPKDEPKKEEPKNEAQVVWEPYPYVLYPTPRGYYYY